MADENDLGRYRANWQEEIDSAFQYRAMASGEKDASVASVYRRLAEMEERHAHFWRDRLVKAGRPPGAARPSWRARTLAFVARRFGASLVLPAVAGAEYRSRNAYGPQAETAGTSMAAQEHTHARVLGTLLTRSTGAGGGTLARLEGRHRTFGGNTLRAAVLGANDGLCSNLSLVMGVAGAAMDTHALLLTGLAGLLAGACSMAIGEWVSVQSSRELAERELSIERNELEETPEDEREELQLIYEAKGLSAEEARDVSMQLIRDPQAALDVLSREELGLNPDDLGGSPWTAALSSFVLFAVGAAVPVLPLFFLQGSQAAVASAAASAIGLVFIGTAISVFTGRPVWITAPRQLLLGLAAASVTFAIGRAIGVSLAG